MAVLSLQLHPSDGFPVRHEELQRAILTYVISYSLHPQGWRPCSKGRENCRLARVVDIILGSWISQVKNLPRLW